MAMRTKTYSIYSIRNKLNSKRYIGLSHKPQKRMEQHQKSKFLIGKAIRKYGWNNFNKQILQNNLTLKQAKKRERFYIKKYNCIQPNGYNLCGGGEGLFNPTQKIRIAISKAKKGKKLSKNHKKILKETNIGNQNAKGKRSKKQIENMKRANSLSHIKKKRKKAHEKAWKTRHKNGTDKPSKESNIKRSKSLKGKRHSKKSKEKLSKSMKGNQNALGCKRSAETRAKISKANKNPATKTRKKLRKAKLGKNNPNYKQRKIRICACGCKQTFECKFDSLRKFICGHNLRMKNIPQHKSGKDHPQYKHGKHCRKSSQ